jgi:uncharacterized protein YdeI (YjbR/CyaY-like superfamily)
MNPRVDWYFEKPNKWQKELRKLRDICLETQLAEELKWGCPCYVYQKKNIVLIHDFKDYCALLLFKGALMKDPKKILIQQTENVQSARQIRFTSLKEIVKLERTIKAYIFQAIEVEESGKKVALKKTTDFAVPEEFQKKLSKSGALRKAFFALTPGRQRGYLFHFSQAKQSKTREARVEKYVPKILKDEGIDD